MSRLFSSITDTAAREKLISRIEQDVQVLMKAGCVNVKAAVLYLTRFCLNAFVDQYRMKALAPVYMPLAASDYIASSLNKGKKLPYSIPKTNIPFAKNGVVYTHDVNYYLSKKQPLESYVYYCAIVKEWLDTQGYRGKYSNPIVQLKALILGSGFGE